LTSAAHPEMFIGVENRPAQGFVFAKDDQLQLFICGPASLDWKLLRNVVDIILFLDVTVEPPPFADHWEFWSIKNTSLRQIRNRKINSR